MMIRVVLCLFAIIANTECANILGIFPAPGYSQFILGEKLLKELANKGHNITMISSYEPATKIANFTVIQTPEVAEHFKDANPFNSVGTNPVRTLIKSQQTGLYLTQHTLANPGVQNLLQSQTSFDLVILEQFFDEALTGFARHFSAPLILFSSLGSCEWTNNIMGNPVLPSIMPHTKFGFTTRMTFWQRSQNLAMSIFDALYKKFVIYPQHDALIKRYFPKCGRLEDVMYNASLMLLNSHYAITNPSPLVPGMVEIGGFYIETKGLPHDLNEFMDEAKDGVIYFSMGTNLKASNLDQPLTEAILDMFSKLKQRVVWKSDKDFSDIPPNVIISKWLPQIDILAHPNTKVFISHGGLLSTIEAVHFTVPMILTPIFGDQYMNTAKVIEYGFGLNIPYQDMTAENLRFAIMKILQDDRLPVQSYRVLAIAFVCSFKQNIVERSKHYHDQVVSPLDLAIFWIEYVLRHKGARLLRPATMDLHWYQLYGLDVFGIIVIALSIMFIIFVWLCRTDGRKLKAE